jgi:SAM-dependent methyltransferase
VDVYRDREVVRREYASEERLLARASIYAGTGRDANDVLIEAIAAQRPGDVLEVGCGPGRLAERLRDERGIRVTAVDSSERMVALTRGRSCIDARLGDVQALAFADQSFDVVIAAWMLYHVTDLHRGLREIARVLRPGGTLIATTNSEQHLGEMWRLVGLDHYPAALQRRERRRNPRPSLRERRSAGHVGDGELPRSGGDPAVRRVVDQGSPPGEPDSGGRRAA